MFIPTQIVNFWFIPPHMRFVAVNVVALFWSAYLFFLVDAGTLLTWRLYPVIIRCVPELCKCCEGGGDRRGACPPSRCRRKEDRGGRIEVEIFIPDPAPLLYTLIPDLLIDIEYIVCNIVFRMRHNSSPMRSSTRSKRKRRQTLEPTPNQRRSRCFTILDK